MAKREVIEVKVSERVLWIGAEAYPLRNIARATTIKIEPRRAWAAGRFLKSLLVLAILVVAAVAGIEASDLSSSDKQEAMRGVTIASLVLLAIFILQLISVLTTKTYYALVIETSGTPRTLLASTDSQEVHQLVHQIMAAIDNPLASFTKTIINYRHVGDNVNVGGNRNVGKVGT